MRNLTILVAALLLGCSSTGESIEAAINARLRSQLTSPDALLVDVSCDNFSAETKKRGNSPDFAALYPNGLYVVCAVNKSGDSGSATVRRLLYHGSLRMVVISEETSVTLRRSHQRWVIKSWTTTAIDYAPPPPPPA